MSHPYVPSNETDIRETFKKAIAKQDAAKPVKPEKRMRSVK
jgi:hypothetical protein